jgi:hypothetical protein
MTSRLTVKNIFVTGDAAFTLRIKALPSKHRVKCCLLSLSPRIMLDTAVSLVLTAYMAGCLDG